jgi:hypothetical protein
VSTIVHEDEPRQPSEKVLWKELEAIKLKSQSRPRQFEKATTLLGHSYDHETTCGICGWPCGVTHGIDLSYVVDVGGPRKNMKNRQVRPLKCEEAPMKYLLDPKVMKE